MNEVWSYPLLPSYPSPHFTPFSFVFLSKGYFSSVFLSPTLYLPSTPHSSSSPSAWASFLVSFVLIGSFIWILCFLRAFFFHPCFKFMNSFLLCCIQGKQMSIDMKLFPCEVPPQMRLLVRSSDSIINFEQIVTHGDKYNLPGMLHMSEQGHLQNFDFHCHVYRLYWIKT